jgi:hypothetical protein
MVAQQLAEAITRRHRDAVPSGKADLQESFEVFLLRADRIEDAKAAGNTVQLALERTPLWHHQVHSGESAIGIAHSTAAAEKEKTWAIVDFFRAPLAAKVARAIKQLDVERADEGIEVSLVTAPAFQLDVFLLKSFETVEVYVISVGRRSSGFVEGQYYSQADFLRNLPLAADR